MLAMRKDSRAPKPLPIPRGTWAQYPREYQSWRDMIRRCDDPRHPRYKYYGGRGIRVQSELYDFRRFFAELGECPPGFTLDRINFNYSYMIGNLRWASRKDQQNNRRTSVKYLYQGQMLTCTELAGKVGMNRQTLRKRLFYMTVEEAVARPKRKWVRRSVKPIA